MFNFSTKTLVNKEFKISDILKQIKASKEVKEDSKKINKIFLQNVINAKTLNLNDVEESFKEIYVFRLLLNVDKIPELFIKELDKSINFHTYFICEYDGFVSTLMAFKEINRITKISTKYYKHPFQNESNIELPLINKVSDVYNILLSYETNNNLKNMETPNEFIERVNKINKLEFQISKTEKAIIYETQPKKKFEYNERLREYKKELSELKKVED